MTLLSQLVLLWRNGLYGEEGFFDLQGRVLRISLDDIYFLMRLPTSVLIQDASPSLPRGMTMDELAVCHYEHGVGGLTSTGMIRIKDIEDRIT